MIKCTSDVFFGIANCYYPRPLSPKCNQYYIDLQVSAGVDLLLLPMIATKYMEAGINVMVQAIKNVPRRWTIASEI